jgi:hypothetical protein
VVVEDGRPVRLSTDRHGLDGGKVEACAGPWRTSGEWWKLSDARWQATDRRRDDSVGWDRDEWDVALSDGGVYRVYRDREGDRWFVDAVID